MNDLVGKDNDDWMMNHIASSQSIPSGSVSPLQLGLSHATSLTDTQHDSTFGVKHGFVVTPDKKAKALVFDNNPASKSLHDRYQELLQSSSKDSYDHEEDYDDDKDDTYEESTMDYVSQNKRPSRKLKKGDRIMDAGGKSSSIGAVCTSNKKKNIITNPSTPFTRKYVGETVAADVKVRDVLRKKFSWKSFPELEIYLINHRKQYLECSNAMNYTKAQKSYNNELTQGLLQLAANEGYVFEDFTFAAVRDRIRCFYKSFVQATKKKKRAHHHHKQQQQQN